MFFSVFRQILVTLVDEQAIAFFFLATQQRVFLGKSSALQSRETSFPPNRLTFISDWAVPVVAFERWVSLSKEVKVTLISMPFSIHIVCMRCCTLFLIGRGSCGYNCALFSNVVEKNLNNNFEMMNKMWQVLSSPPV